jgi:hypothetical protein
MFQCKNRRQTRSCSPSSWLVIAPSNSFVVLHGGVGHEYANGVCEEFLARGNAQSHELGESGKTDG